VFKVHDETGAANATLPHLPACLRMLISSAPSTSEITPSAQLQPRIA